MKLYAVTVNGKAVTRTPIMNQIGEALDEAAETSLDPCLRRLADALLIA